MYSEESSDEESCPSIGIGIMSTSSDGYSLSSSEKTTDIVDMECTARECKDAIGIGKGEEKVIRGREET